MKNLSTILSAAALVIAVVFGAITISGNCKKCGKAATSQADSISVDGPIAFVNLDRIVNEYDMANDLKAVVETKAQNIDAELTRRGKKLENDIAAFQDKARKGLMTSAVAETQQNKLQQQQNDFLNYQQKKQAEIQEEQLTMMRNIYDAVKTYIDKYNAEAGYSFIFANQSGMPAADGSSLIDFPILCGAAALDITDAIIAGLNEEYVAGKNSGSTEAE